MFVHDFFSDVHLIFKFWVYFYFHIIFFDNLTLLEKREETREFDDINLIRSSIRKNNIELYSESYHKFVKKTSFGKIIYQSYVDCFMLKNNVKYFKVQSFNSKTVWKKYNISIGKSLLDERYASLQYSLSHKAKSV